MITINKDDILEIRGLELGNGNFCHATYIEYLTFRNNYVSTLRLAARGFLIVPRACAELLFNIAGLLMLAPLVILLCSGNAWVGSASEFSCDFINVPLQFQ